MKKIFRSIKFLLTIPLWALGVSGCYTPNGRSKMAIQTFWKGLIQCQTLCKCCYMELKMSYTLCFYKSELQLATLCLLLKIDKSRLHSKQNSISSVILKIGQYLINVSQLILFKICFSVSIFSNQFACGWQRFLTTNVIKQPRTALCSTLFCV